jgi:hypothetical protein
MEQYSLLLEGNPEAEQPVEETGNRQQVEDLIISLNEVATQIKNMDTIIRALDDNPEQQKEYAFQLLDIVKEYNEIYNNLVIALEAYQQHEKDSGAPIDLNFRRLYRTLMNPSVKA